MAYGPHGKLSESWWGTSTPATGPVGTSTTWVGIHLGITAPGRITGIRQYVPSTADGNWYGVIYDVVNSRIVAAQRFKPLPAGHGDQWHQTFIRPYLRIDTAIDYWVAVPFVGAHYWRTNNAIGGGGTAHGDITFLNGWQSTVLFPFGGAVTYNLNANALDVLFLAD